MENLNLQVIHYVYSGSYSNVNITDLVNIPVIYRFENITMDKTTINENKKGDVLIIQQQDNVLFESGDSSLEIELNIST